MSAASTYLFTKTYFFRDG